MLPNRLPVEMIRAVERSGGPEFRVQSAGPDGVTLTAAGYPSIHLFARGPDLVARCAGVEHAAPLWSLDHLAAVLLPYIANPLPDIGEDLRKILRKVKLRLKPPAPAVPLTVAQQADVERIKPLVIGMIRRRFPGVRDKKALIDEAMPLLCEAVQAWDGRGSLSGFVCERVYQRLCSWIGGQARQIPQHPVDFTPIRGPRGKSVVPGVGPEPAYRDDPSRPLRLAEAATAARRNLSAEEVHALKLNLAGLTSGEIARREHYSERKARYLLANARRAIREAAKTSGFPAEEIATAVLACQDDIRARALRLLGEN